MKLKLIIVLFALSFSGMVVARCTTVTSTSSLTTDLISQGYTAASWSGANSVKGTSGITDIITVSDASSFQPSGTLLASSTVDFLTNAKSSAYSAMQILFRCDIADADEIYEIYSRRASSTKYAGRTESSEIDDAYFSYVKNVAIRLTNTTTGEYYSRYWKMRKLTSSDWIQDNSYIYIPASAFSGVTFEIFKIDGTDVFGTANNYTYARANPLAQIALKGPRLNAGITEGTDQNSTSGTTSTYAALWSITGVSFVRGGLCEVKSYPSVVIIPTISAQNLESGGTSSETFSISLSCESSATSGVNAATSSSSNVALGFLVNQTKAVNAATNLGLTSGGGLTYLLDSNYGDDGIASGVGIVIYDQNSNQLNLLSSNVTGTGNSGGWYAYKDITTSEGDTDNGITTYTGEFTAVIQQILGETVRAGTVSAQLQVIVSIQ